MLLILFLVTFSLAAIAQPTLPDIAGDEQNGLVLLSWTCQYDGVKSIAVLRSTDSSFNYSTIGYVKKLYKGAQAYIDGHPLPGKNYYKLSIVFNSGLTWGSNHCGVYIDSIAVRKSRNMPSNDALQKMIVTETIEKQAKPVNSKLKSPVAPADKDKYMEVYKKEAPVAKADTVAMPPKPQYKVKTDDDIDVLTVESYVDKLPEETRKKISITYDDDSEEAIDPSKYIEEKKPVEQKKKVNVTFDDKSDVSKFVENLPKSETRKFVVTYNNDTDLPDAGKYLEDNKKADQGKKVSVTLKDEHAVQAYMDALPKTVKNKITVSYNVDTVAANAKKMTDVAKTEVAKTEVVKPEVAAPPKQKISIKFSDDMNVNAAADIKSKYIFNDAISGNVTFDLPEDILTHHYSVKFYDKDNHAVIEIPKINTAKVILDKRNFQKKGQYRFVLRRDIVELETGYVNIY